MSEPVCHCPMTRKTDFQHDGDCAWVAWKRAPKPESIMVLEAKPRCVQLNMAMIVMDSTLIRALTPLNENLVASIRSHGVQEPIVVHKHNRFYTVVEGIQRVRAAKVIGMDSIPAVIV